MPRLLVNPIVRAHGTSLHKYAESQESPSLTTCTQVVDAGGRGSIGREATLAQLEKMPAGPHGLVLHVFLPARGADGVHVCITA